MRLLLLAVLLSGCTLSTEDIVAKLDECKKNNLHPDVYRLFGNGKVIEIQCTPIREVCK